MKKIWYPDDRIDCIYDVDVEKLKSEHITTIICDVDNTLCQHDEDELSAEVKKWIQSAQASGLKVILISNNHVSRIKKIACDVHCEAYGFALKPFPHTYWRMMKNHHLKKEEMICIGDQLFTDILGAKLMKLRNIYVKPISSSDIIYTKFSRKIENWLLKEKI